MSARRVAAVVLCVGSLALIAPARAQEPPPVASQLPAEDPATSARKMADEVRQAIAGKEEQPAKDVFKNVMIFGEMPAGRLLRMMEMGWSRALGVDCSHCHVPGNFASDEKRAKNVARGMTELVGTIRAKLKTIEALGDENPTVNCTTCHRGQVKPARDLPAPRS